MIWYQYVASAICILASAKLIPEIIENKNLSKYHAAKAKTELQKAKNEINKTRIRTRNGGAKRTKRKNNKRKSKKRTKKN